MATIEAVLKDIEYFKNEREVLKSKSLLIHTHSTHTTTKNKELVYRKICFEV